MDHWRERLFGALKGKHFVRIISPLLGVVVLAAFLVSNASADTTPTTYYACVNMKNGSIYMVNASDTCQKGYTPMSWNQVGPQGPQGPAGPQGLQGPQGPQGPAGPTQTLTITRQSGGLTPILPGEVGTATAHCPTGTLVIGGDFEFTTSNAVVVESAPDLSQNAWIVEGFNPGPGDVGLIVDALCASLA